MILLDTHIWYWWASGDTSSIPAPERERLASAPALAVSAMSCLEIALLVRRGRISLDMPLTDWFEMALVGSGIQLLPLSPRIAERAVGLPEHHKDPADRVIIATALEHQFQVISLDGAFRRYQELEPFLLPARSQG